MKKVLGIIIFTLLTTFLCAEEFKGVYDIKFGQNPSEVKTNIEKMVLLKKIFLYIVQSQVIKKLFLEKNKLLFMVSNVNF